MTDADRQTEWDRAERVARRQTTIAALGVLACLIGDATAPWWGDPWGWPSALIWLAELAALGACLGWCIRNWVLVRQ